MKWFLKLLVRNVIEREIKREEVQMNPHWWFFHWYRRSPIYALFTTAYPIFHFDWENSRDIHIECSKHPGVWKYHKYNLATLCDSSQPRAQLYWVRISVNFSYGISIWIWVWNVSTFLTWWLLWFFHLICRFNFWATKAQNDFFEVLSNLTLSAKEWLNSNP